MSLMKTAIKPPPEAPFIVLAGLAGAGKTSMASLMPNPFFIQLESGFKGFDDENLPDATPDLVEDYQTLLRWITDFGAGDHGYDTLIIDSATPLNDMIKAETVRTSPAKKDMTSPTTIKDSHGGYRGGEEYAMQLHRDLITRLLMLAKVGYNVIVTAHSKVVKCPNIETGDEYLGYRINVGHDEESMNAWVAAVDAIYFINTRSVVKNKGKGRNSRTGLVQDVQGRELIVEPSSFFGTKDKFSMGRKIPFLAGECPLLHMKGVTGVIDESHLLDADAINAEAAEAQAGE